jgi:RNA polymerase sigma factor (sigma-70 family)
MMTENPISQWLEGLASGDESAVRRIWDHYFERLLHLARKKLGDADRRMADEEDVALSAFRSFCRGAKQGRFPRLNDREDFWKLLIVITARKASNQRRHAFRLKRGSGKVRGESALGQVNEPEFGGIGEVLGREPTPEIAAELNEQLSRLLDRLEDPSLKTMAMRKLEGYSSRDIAEELGCVERTVRRGLARIREVWQNCLEEDCRAE